MFNHLLSKKITPNQLYLLYCCKNNLKPLYINYHVDSRILQLEEMITSDLKLTDKGDVFITEIEAFAKKKQKKEKIVLSAEDLSVAEEYRLIFPGITLPSGVLARISAKELLQRFGDFFKEYPQHHDWELILKVTRLYVDSFESKGYQGMRNSAYFIIKENPINKSLKISDLATWCDKYKEDGGKNQPQDLKLLYQVK